MLQVVLLWIDACCCHVRIGQQVQLPIKHWHRMPGRLPGRRRFDKTLGYLIAGDPVGDRLIRQDISKRAERDAAIKGSGNHRRVIRAVVEKVMGEQRVWLGSSCCVSPCVRLAAQISAYPFLAWSGRHRSFADQDLFFLVQRLLGRLHDARVDLLAAARNVAVLGELAIDRFENALAGTGLEQALPEYSDLGPIRNLAAGMQADEALDAQTIDKLEFHLLIVEVEQRLDQQYADRQFCGKRLAAAPFTAGAWRHTVDLGGECREVDIAALTPAARSQACSAWLRAPARQTEWF